MTSSLKRLLIWGIPLLLVLLALAIGRALVARQAAQQAASAPAAPVVIELAEGDVVTARSGTLVRSLPVSGTLKAVQTAVVRAKVAGEVQTLDVREGDSVKLRQPIGRIDASEYELRLRQAQQQADSARAQLDIAQRTLDNNRALVDQGFISKNALDTSVSNAAAARAALQAALAAADLARKAVDDTLLRAPIAGQVSQRLVQPGERVGVDARLVEIVDLSHIELEAALTPEDVARVQPRSQALLRVDGLPQPVAAHVARINPSTQPGTRAVSVYLAVTPQPGLRHGLFASGQLELARETALLLPESSVRLDRPEPYVLLVEGGKVAARTVKVGTRGSVREGSREAVLPVLDGLREGEQVLAGAVGRLAEGSRIRLTPLPKSSGTPQSH